MCLHLPLLKLGLSVISVVCMLNLISLFSRVVTWYYLTDHLGRVFKYFMSLLLLLTNQYCHLGFKGMVWYTIPVFNFQVTVSSLDM